MLSLTAISIIAAISFLLKTSFHTTKWTVIMGLLGAFFSFLATTWVTETSQDTFLQIANNRSVRLNTALIVFIDSAIILSYCFQNTFQQASPTPQNRIVNVLLSAYPGLLFLGAICVFQAQVFFHFAGIDFNTAAVASAFACFLSIVIGSLALKRAIGECHIRMELLFITQVILIIISIFITGK